MTKDARVYSRTISAAEAAIIYCSQGNDTIAKDLILWCRMAEKPDGTAASGVNSVRDFSGNGNYRTPQNTPTCRAVPEAIIKPIQGGYNGTRSDI